MKRKPKLHLVGNDPADVFNDLGKLQEEMAAPAPRKRMTVKFAMIPHDQVRLLGQQNISGAAWYLLLEIDRLVFESFGKNPVKVTRRCAPGLSRHTKRRALRQLVKAGVVSIEQKPGRAPLATLLWRPTQ
jgi:hypothetical protein